MRSFTGPSGFQGVVEAAREAGPGSFMISPGDIDPPQAVYNVLSSVLGTGYPWYPVAGNHEAETPEDMAWLRSFNAGGTTLPHVVNKGPGGPGGPSLPGAEETCYSFDWGKAHFTVINEYYTGSTDSDPTGDVSPALLAWLETDLAGTTQPVRFVVGHEPAYPQPDSEPPHRFRHETDSLNAFSANRDAFWRALVNYGVKAYICGHTHDYSVVWFDGVRQIDSGHARGLSDTGARSTFLRITVGEDDSVSYQTWRQNLTTGKYGIADSGGL